MVEASTLEASIALKLEAIRMSDTLDERVDARLETMLAEVDEDA